MKEMGIKNLAETINFELDIKVDSREIFINKFIEKFPKANLHTLTQINKYYNKKKTNTIEVDKNFSVISIYDYLSIFN
jgi:hypothetical protein